MNPLIFLTLLGIGILALAAGCSARKETVALQDKDTSSNALRGEITVNPTEVRQTIEGFGASAAWWAQDVGGWENDKRQRIVDLLFNPEKGIGLTIYRYNIGGGDGENIQDPWRRAETFEVATGQYDWSRDANAVWLMKAARTAGAQQFVAFVNSPPERMTVSGLTTGEKDGKSNLRPEMYAEFARYMVDVVRHLREDEDIPIGYISPFNEPQWNWSYKNGQEGCHYSPDEVVAVTKALLQAIRESSLDVKVSVFESGEWKKSEVYFDKLLGDPEIAPFLNHLSVHSYWSDASDKAHLVRYLDKYYPNHPPLWMTEWTEMKDNRDMTMDSALVLANIVHDDLTIGGVTSWQYWIAVSKYFFRDGFIYVNLTDHEVIVTKRLWAMGNFSRYVRPGYTRVEASNSLETLRVTAYRSPDQSKFVLVVINNSDKATATSLNGIPAYFARAIAYETSADKDLQQISSGSVPQSFTFAPLSVTTIVFNR